MIYSILLCLTFKESISFKTLSKREHTCSHMHTYHTHMHTHLLCALYKQSHSQSDTEKTKTHLIDACMCARVSVYISIWWKDIDYISIFLKEASPLSPGISHFALWQLPTPAPNFLCPNSLFHCLTQFFLSVLLLSLGQPY